MTYEEKIAKYVKTAKEEGRTERYYANTIQYLFVTDDDGWIGILKEDEFGYHTVIQAADRGHAISYVEIIEPAPFGMNLLV